MHPPGIEQATLRFPARRSNHSATLPFIDMLLKLFRYFWILINMCDNASMKLIMVWFVHTQFYKQ